MYPSPLCSTHLAAKDSSCVKRIESHENKPAMEHRKSKWAVVVKSIKEAHIEKG